MDHIPDRTPDLLRTAGLARQEPRNVADAIERQARLDAMIGYLGTVRDDVRAWLDARAEQTKQETGAAANWPVKGWGRAYKTDPDDRMYVTDSDAADAWVTENLPAARRTVWRFRPDKIDAAMSDAETVEEAWDAAEKVLLEHGHDLLVPETVIVKDALIEAVSKLPTAPRDEQNARIVVDPETGEHLPFAWRPAARPTLTVTIDKDAKQRVAEELTGLLGAPQIGE